MRQYGGMMVTEQREEQSSATGGIPTVEEAVAAGRPIERLQQRHALRWAGALRAQGDHEGAKQVLDAVYRRNGESSGWLEEAARHAYAVGDFPEAERLLRERVRQFPSVTADVALGRFLLECGRLEEAHEIATELVASQADKVTVTILAADAAQALGQHDLARGYYMAVADARGEHPSGLLTLAELYHAEGDLDVAKSFFSRVVYAYNHGDYRLGPSTAERIAAMAETLGDPAIATDFRQRAEIEQRQIILNTAAEIRSALDALDTTGRATPIPVPAGNGRAAQPVEPPAPRRQPVAPAVIEQTPPREARPEALAALRELFGHDQFREGQVDVIERMLDGVDTLAIIPTGGGKSLTYQLPAMLLPGVTLVVSPLIALMKDQVESAPASVRDRITLINSDIDAEERRRRLNLVRNGDIKLLYVAPERMLDPTLRRSLMDAGLARIVIDEAHCISLWGHDFRPDYLTIPLALRDLGQPPVLAVTATATPEIAEQIATALGRALETVRTSVFRENLFYEVIQVADRNERIGKLIELCRQQDGHGIVYVSSRDDAESFAQTLRQRGVQAQAYHAGMERGVRAAAHERFMSGQVRVMVATVAFGMGVDKADVRFIIHMMPPGTVESYAQESGRAGRDGQRARCVLLTTKSDRSTLRARARRDLVSLDTLRKTYIEVRRLQRSGWSAVDLDALRSILNMDSNGKDEVDARVALGYLQQAGLIARAPDAPVRLRLRRKSVVGRSLEDEMADDPNWTALLPSLGDGWYRGDWLEIDTATVSAALSIEPAQLDALLADRDDVQLGRDQRGAWYRMLPAPADTGRVMDRLLASAKDRADERIDQIMTYIDGHECRHRLLAAALGESIRPCGDACDVCDPAHALVKPSTTQRAARAKRTATADDALIVLRALKEMPFAVGKRGIVRLLSGSPESSVQADRSNAFGALQDLGTSRIERLVDQLVESGFLDWRQDGDYRLLAMTRTGASATRDDLELLTGLARKSAASGGEGVDLSIDQTQLYDKLVAWRLEEAREQNVPPYVIAHNSMLREIARTRPSTDAQLGAVPGLGKTRAERYGSAILAIVNG
jgi:ATP-dependent DNA helicase RecQ